MGSSSSRGGDEPTIENDSTMDSDNVDENSSASEYERSAEDLISVFQILIRNGQIHIMSSGEDDSEDGAYSPRTRSPKAPKIQHQPDTSTILENDLHVRLSRHKNQPKGLTQLLAARELGGVFEGPEQKSNFSSHFLPNTIKRIANFGHKAFCGSYSKSGDIFLSAAQDRNIRIYETGGGRFSLIKQIQARDVGWSVLDTAFSPDGRHIVYSSWSECIHMVSIYGETERQESLCLCPDNRRFAIFSLVFSDDGVEILGGANDGYLYIYNRESNERVLKIAGHEDDVNSVSFADESSHILYSAADDGLCKVWDRRTLNESDPRPVGIFAGHIDGITYVEGKRDGRYLLTNSKDQSIKLWDMRLFSSDQAVRNTRKAVIEQSWDYRWQRVPKRLCIERRPFEGDTSVMTYRGHSVLNTLIRAKFSPGATTEQRYIYTGCAAGRVVIYDLLSGEIVKILRGHKACVRDVSWHPHRAEIVSTSWDNSLGLWTYEGRHYIDSDEETVGYLEPDEGNRPPRRSTRLAEKERQRSVNHHASQAL